MADYTINKIAYDGNTYNLKDDTSGYVKDVKVNNSSVVSGGIAQITDSSGNLGINGYLKTGDNIYLPNNKRLYGKESDGTTDHMLIGIDNTDLIHIGSNATASSVTIGMYGSNVTLTKAGNLTLDGSITAFGHASRIGADGPSFSKGSYTQKTTSSVNTLGTIAMTPGDWILKGWIQFPGGTAGYRRVWVTSDSGTTATGNGLLNQSYAAGSTICTVQSTIFIHISSNLTYYLRGASNVELSINYCDITAIRIS